MAHLAIFCVNDSGLMVVSCTGIKQTLNQLLIHAEQGGGKERLRWLRGKGIREKKRTKKETNLTESI